MDEPGGILPVRVTVPYLPIRCPRCQARRPRVNGTHVDKAGDWIRYHICRNCSLVFNSRELAIQPV